MRRRLSGKDEALFRRATGTDEKWRMAWVDESVPDELKIGDVVVALNDLPLPEGSIRMSLGAVFGGGAIVSASAFDSDPGTFARQGQQRATIPAHTMLEVRTRDEFRWLAAFGTYFVASATAVGRADLFANEVVVALGGDPEAGLRLARRIRALGLQADLLALSEFRLSSMAEHVQGLRELARAQAEVPR
jgi:hypothetical protein